MSRSEAKATLLISMSPGKEFPEYVTGRPFLLEDYGLFDFVVNEDVGQAMETALGYDSWGGYKEDSKFKDLPPGLYCVEINVWAEAYQTCDGPEGDCGVEFVSFRPYSAEYYNYFYSYSIPKEEDT